MGGEKILALRLFTILSIVVFFYTCFSDIIKWHHKREGMHYNIPFCFARFTDTVCCHAGNATSLYHNLHSYRNVFPVKNEGHAGIELVGITEVRIPLDPAVISFFILGNLS